MTYDLAVIGAGPGGYVAAIRAAQLGLKTVLIEKEHVGGTCLNRGCIPTKSVVAVAERFKERDPAEFGIEGVDSAKAAVNMAKVVERKDKIVAGLRVGIGQLLESNKIDLITGAASFASKDELKVVDPAGNELPVTSRDVIIATGSIWREIPGLKTDGKFVITSDEMLDLKALPKRLVIVGGGVIGCEFASIMNIFGVDVSIVEMTDQLLPTEDAAISRQLSMSFKKRGIKIFTKATVTEAGKGIVKLSTVDNLGADLVLVSIGRRPFTDGLGIEAAGVETQKGFILTDDKMRTNVPNIYAIGDVAVPGAKGFKPALAHVASKEGMVAVTNIKGEHAAVMNYNVVPRPIFTIPEIGCVGATEKELKNNNVKYKTGRFSYAALSKAVCDSATNGLLQVYSDEVGHILGAHCMGNHASDICAEASLAMETGLNVRDIERTIHAHPTYSEIMMEACEDVEGHAIHKAGGR
ncbi:MAG: dihydrolipoyl dehydrogenase [Deltaproteobacteria bacterium CG11_big_fil_rev_8_21_14_0_20_49_13]|nr:MAG: dihydrolipoyl dehydrogenase [Deltaproteobacteria bacterium CG11_big_fil_rev_8_21_14_0_20_49_13]